MIIHGLQCKRAEIAGRLEVAHAEISRLAVDLASIDATIRLFAKHADLDEITPKKPQAPGAAMPGSISRVVLAALRDAPAFSQPVTWPWLSWPLRGRHQPKHGC